MIIDLEHPLTVVQVDNIHELFYVLKWCESKGKSVSAWMYDRTEFPFFIGTAGNIIGWNERSDRALTYVPFEEFIQ